MRVIGASPNTVDQQSAFKAKYSLPFTLVADENHSLAEQFGVWVLRERDGKQFMGIQRSTFIIGPDARVQRAFEQVTPDGHAQELLSALREQP